MKAPLLRARVTTLLGSSARKIGQMDVGSETSQAVRSEVLKELVEIEGLMDLLEQSERREVLSRLAGEVLILVLRYLGNTCNCFSALLQRWRIRCSNWVRLFGSCVSPGVSLRKSSPLV